MNYLLVAIGGLLGSLSRYWLGGLISHRWPLAFPLGTFVVNISGSFLVGLLFTLGAERGLVPPAARVALGIGFLGAYTTFSTWSLETLRLVQTGSWGLAGANILGSVAAGLASVWLGMVAGRAL